MKSFGRELNKELIELAKRGDGRALEAIYNHYVNDSYQLAYKFVYEPSLAEDITQEAFIKVINNVHHYQFNGSFSGWIRRIVVNESINRVKHEKRLEVIFSLGGEDVDNMELFKSNWLSECRDLEWLLKQLPLMHRTVLVLHEIEGYKHREIAEMLDRTESFSKMTLLRAFKQLKEISSQQEVSYALNR